MRKVLLAVFLLSSLLLLTALLSGCSGASWLTAPSVTSHFAFIREASGAGVHPARVDQRGSRAFSARSHRLRPHTLAAGRVFAADIGTGTDSIILMKNDGTGETTVANEAGWFYSVQLSLDGRKGVFIAEDSAGVQQIYTVDMTATTLNPVQVTTGTNDHYYAQFNADASKIIFVTYSVEGEWGQAAWISSTGGTETVIPSPGKDVYLPSFTPDGKIIYEEDNCDSLEMMDINGAVQGVLTNADCAELDESPSVSADGKKLVFARGNDNVMVADLNGTTVSNITPLTTDGQNWDPMIVNDRIVYISYKDGAIGGEVYSMKFDGTDVKRLTNNQVDEYFIW